MLGKLTLGKKFLLLALMAVLLMAGLLTAYWFECQARIAAAERVRAGVQQVLRGAAGAPQPKTGFAPPQDTSSAGSHGAALGRALLSAHASAWPGGDAKLREAIDSGQPLSETTLAALDATLAAHAAGLRQRQLMLITAAGLAALVALLFGYAVMRSLARPLKQALGMAQRFASGDLTRRGGAVSSDEVGRLLDALNLMRGGLAASVADIRAAADNVAVAAQQMARGNADLSLRTETQSTNLVQTAAAMTRFTQGVQQNAQGARSASTLAQDAAAVATRGGEAARGVASTMQGIAESSSRIADIVGVIEGIAFQTNILALNAAVEAARAGEQGRGFSVVAAEVRTLAQRSAQAAKEIKSLIEDSTARVDGGVREVRDAGKTMDDIVAAVAKLKDLIADIARASAEQLQGIAQVNGAIAQMEGSTQQNAALVQQAASGARHMAHQAQVLTASVAKFKLEEGAAAREREAKVHSLHAAPAAVTASTSPAPDPLPAAHSPRPLPRASDGDWKTF